MNLAWTGTQQRASLRAGSSWSQTPFRCALNVKYQASANCCKQCFWGFPGRISADPCQDQKFIFLATLAILCTYASVPSSAAQPTLSVKPVQGLSCHTVPSYVDEEARLGLIIPAKWYH